MATGALRLASDVVKASFPTLKVGKEAFTDSPADTSRQRQWRDMKGPFIANFAMKGPFIARATDYEAVLKRAR